MATGTRIDPYRGFRFRVEIDGIQTASFSEATIPDSTTDVVEYREGSDETTMRKIPGLTKYGNLTLKKGLTDSMELYEWRKKVVQLGATKARKNISIILVDEEGKDKARWDISDAWPIKYAPSALSAKGNEIMIEQVEIVNEGILRVK